MDLSWILSLTLIWLRKMDAFGKEESIFSRSKFQIIIHLLPQNASYRLLFIIQISILREMYVWIFWEKIGNQFST